MKSLHLFQMRNMKNQFLSWLKFPLKRGNRAPFYISEHHFGSHIKKEKWSLNFSTYLEINWRAVFFYTSLRFPYCKLVWLNLIENYQMMQDKRYAIHLLKTYYVSWHNFRNVVYSTLYLLHLSFVRREVCFRQGRRSAILQLCTPLFKCQKGVYK